MKLYTYLVLSQQQTFIFILFMSFLSNKHIYFYFVYVLSQQQTYLFYFVYVRLIEALVIPLVMVVNNFLLECVQEHTLYISCLLL